jgi:hypothetical protein
LPRPTSSTWSMGWGHATRRRPCSTWSPAAPSIPSSLPGALTHIGSRQGNPILRGLGRFERDDYCRAQMTSALPERGNSTGFKERWWRRRWAAGDATQLSAARRWFRRCGRKASRSVTWNECRAGGRGPPPRPRPGLLFNAVEGPGKPVGLHMWSPPRTGPPVMAPRVICAVMTVRMGAGSRGVSLVSRPRRGVIP